MTDVTYQPSQIKIADVLVQQISMVDDIVVVPTSVVERGTGSHDTANDWTWLISFTAAMVPFTAFCYGHSKGMTVRVVNAVVKSPLGPAGLLLLPFCTLAMEKSIYDTVQAAQGIDPTTRPADRGGFPSGGAELFPSLSFIPVQPRNMIATIFTVPPPAETNTGSSFERTT
jgi:hypothetical protein